MFLVDLMKRVTGTIRKDSQWLSKMAEEETRKVEIVRIAEEGSFAENNLCITVSYCNVAETGRGNLKYVVIAHPSYRPFGNLQREPVRLNEARYGLVNNWKTMMEKNDGKTFTVHLGKRKDLKDYLLHIG